MKKDFLIKYKQSLKLLSLIKEKKIEIAYSGGKDSDVILSLCNEVGLGAVPVYHATTIDPPYTIKHVKDVGGIIVKPEKTFFEIIAERGFPSRFRRFCCAELKEFPPMQNDTQCVIIGIRRSESIKRKNRYKEPTECLVRKKRHYEAIFPILDWSDNDILEYINLKKIRLHPLYYNNDGKVDVKKRLGCLCCPLQADNGLKDFKQYPNMVKLWIKAYEKYRFNKPEAKSAKIDGYKQFFIHISHRNELLHGELFNTDYKELLENYFNIKL